MKVEDEYTDEKLCKTEFPKSAIETALKIIINLGYLYIISIELHMVQNCNCLKNE